MKKGFESGEQLAAVFGMVNFLLIKYPFSECDLVSEISQQVMELSQIILGV